MIGFRETTLEKLTVDHSVQVNTLTGTASLTVPIRTSPGRESFGPSLALSYGSGEGNSAFGVGWSLSGIPSILVDTSDSLPTYQEGVDRYVYSGGVELVPYLREQDSEWFPVVRDVGSYRVQRFRATIERSFERFEKWTDRVTGRTHWLAYARNGGVSVFGKAGDNSTRIADPSAPDQRTFQWLIEAQYDRKGNAVLYQYKPEDGAGVDPSLSFESRRLAPTANFAQRLIKRIRYGNTVPLSHLHPSDPANHWRFEVVFDYGEHAGPAVPTPFDVPPALPWNVRPDPFSTYRPGFELRTYRLCRRVLMFHSFPELGDEPCLVGATELTHREDPAGTVLETVRYRGYRKDLSTGITADRAVPPLRLGYSVPQMASGFAAAEPADNVPAGLDGAAYQWVDLRNEGLPGILHRQSDGWYFKENLGGGRFGPLETVDEVPASVSAAFHLQDYNNDGNLDLVGFEGREAGYYQRSRENGRWEGFQALRDLPRVDFANARVQWVDLNGDGHADLIVDHLDRLVWYPSEGADGFASPVELAKPDAAAGGVPSLSQDGRLHLFFADMNGDGLPDMVRVENGRVEYWPHLGHGRFGPGVVMEDAPWIEGFGELDAARLRFADLDGSGAASLVYIGRGEVRYWINQSGNRFGSQQRLQNLPFIDQLSSVQVFDFLGDHSQCLVWSTPLPTHEGQAIQYLRLTGDTPPRMLVSVANSAGRETRLSYRSSALEYLRDKGAGRPWRTVLPRHSMVTVRLDGLDHVGGARSATRYEYRDGYFDSGRRRFVGFGLIDSYDTDLLQPAADTAPEEVTPPSLVRTWYHTGSASGFAERAADFYSADPLAVRPPLPMFQQAGQLPGSAAHLTTEEQLDGYRALAGMSWRQEFYTLRPDGTREPHPLRTAEFGYIVSRLQPIVTERDAVFSFFQSELLTYEYEQDASDPRVSHSILLESDPFGNVARRASLAYPRRPVTAAVREAQQALHAQLLQTTCLNVDTPDRFEAGIETEERRYALTGLSPGATGVFRREDFLAQAAAALTDVLEFDAAGAAVGGAPQARRIGLRRSRFWNDSQSAVLPANQVGAVTLLHHVEQAVFPASSVASAFDGRVAAATLSADGHYRLADGYWWAEETTYEYRGAAGFYRLASEALPGGSRTTHTLDDHFLLDIAIEDVFGNRVEASPDYQVLAASAIKDANDNISEVLYDPLAVACVTALRGEQLGDDGAVHPVGADDLAGYHWRTDATAADVLANPGRFLQGASRFLFHDVDAFERGDGPPRSIHLEREQHVHDGQGSAAPSSGDISVRLSYVDGFGRTVQVKVRAGAGPAVQRDASGAVILAADGRPELAHSSKRWLTRGHDVYNNKGWLVRKYEPYFTTTSGFESDEALRRYGVAGSTRYDPAGRTVRQDMPNGTFSTSAFAAWETRQSDGNDNVAGSAYEAARYGLPASDPEKAALTQAQAHAHTPTIVESDPLGRAIRLRELGEGGVERVETTVYGVLGLPDRVVDARGLTAFEYRYDMLGRPFFEHSMDAGDRWTLLDARSHPIHRWDGRGMHTEHRYDQNGRLAETRFGVGLPGLDSVVERFVYGDNPAGADARLRNSRGRLAELYDDTGVVRFRRYHMDGQVIEASRILRSGTDAYKTRVDWSDPTAVALDSTEYRSHHRFDGIGRVVAESVPDGTTREYDYDALGNVSEVRLSTADGRLNRQVIATDIKTNARGQRTRVRLGNGVETEYEYDAWTFRLQRLHTHQTGGVSRDYLDIRYTYDPVGNVTRWLDSVQEPGSATPLIQGLTTSSACEFTYDAFYRLRSATGRVHQALLEHDYRGGLPDADAIMGTRRASLNDGSAVERYTRLYEYDLAGNLQRVRHQGLSRSWTTEMWVSPSSNRSLPKQDLSGIDVADPESRFDANGNTTSLPHLRSMHWNQENRLSRVVIIDRSGTGGPDDAEYYVYGADGLRVRRVTERLLAGGVEVTETIYLGGCEIRRISLDGKGRLLRQTSHISDGAARLATLHQWSMDKGKRETDKPNAKKLHYLVGNHLGSVSLELDEAGGVISYEEYFPFGGTSFVAGDDLRDVKLKEYRYSGKVRDDATGFYSYEHRYYAPFIGRWLSPDPLGPVDGSNLYRFVYNNPIRFVDANGLQAADLKVNQVVQASFPPDIQRQFDADPGLRQRYAEGSVYFIPGGKDKYKPVSKAEAEAYIRAENAADRVPNLVNVGTPSGGISDESFQAMLRSLDEAFAPLDELLRRPGGGAAGTGGGEGDGGGAGTQGDGGDGDGGEGGAGAKPSAHPADGSSGSGSTGQGRTGESGSNGSATTGQGPGAGTQGTGPGGGGLGTTAGKGSEGTGPGAGTGTGGGVGPGSGPGTGPGGLKAGAGGTGGTGSGGGSPGGSPNGTAKGTGTGSSPGQPNGTAENGGTGVPPVPPGLPTGPDGIPYSPDMQLPEVLPETGTPITDPSQIPLLWARRDGRGEPGSESGSGLRPGGTEGGAPGGTPGGSKQGSPGGTPDGQEGGKPGSGRGMKGGMGTHELPAWLSGIDTALDWVQTGLDVIGMIPGLGEIADGLNGLISLMRGDYIGAGLSFAAMIPFAGWAATAGKWGKRAVKAADAVGDTTKAVVKHSDEAASLIGALSRNADEAVELATKNADEAVEFVSKNADEAAQFASKNADDTAQALAKEAEGPSFEGVIDVDEFSNDPNIIDRLSRARENDIGGYYDLTGKGRYGRVGDNLDSHEAFQNLIVRERKGVARSDKLLKDNPAIALGPASHGTIQNLKKPDIVGRTAQDLLKHHIDQLRPFVPDYIVNTLERESLSYIQRTGL